MDVGDKKRKLGVFYRIGKCVLSTAVYITKNSKRFMIVRQIFNILGVLNVYRVSC
jgi:hypothetical protein